MLTTPTKFHLFFCIFNFAWTFLSKGSLKVAGGEVKLGERKATIEFRSAKVGVEIKFKNL